MRSLLFETMFQLDNLYDNLEMCLENPEKTEQIIKKALKNIKMTRDDYVEVMDNLWKYEDNLPVFNGDSISYEDIVHRMPIVWINELDLGDHVRYRYVRPNHDNIVWENDVNHDGSPIKQNTEKHDEKPVDLDCIVVVISEGWNPTTWERKPIVCIRHDEFRTFKLPQNPVGLRLVEVKDGVEVETPIEKLTFCIENKKLMYPLKTYKRMTEEECKEYDKSHEYSPEQKEYLKRKLPYFDIDNSESSEDDGILIFK